MRNLVCTLFAAVLVSSVTAEKDALTFFIKEKMLESTFLSGQNQILAIDLSPECQELALTNLEEAKENVMTCSSATDIALDVGSILDVAFNSTGDLITDLNTVINGIPSCFVDHLWWNLLAVIPCMVGQVKPLWTASTNFIHFRNYYMKTVKKVQEFLSCMHDSKTEANQSVKKIVSMAKLCKMHQ